MAGGEDKAMIFFFFKKEIAAGLYNNRNDITENENKLVLETISLNMER